MAKILLVDDDQIILEVVRDLLVLHGHEVHEAINGHEAIKLQEENTFDLMISDIVMPEKEGLETIRDLKKSGSKLKIIAITGKNYKDGYNYLNAAIALGADGTLAKPFSKEDILSLVDKVLKS